MSTTAFSLNWQTVMSALSRVTNTGHVAASKSMNQESVPLSLEGELGLDI